MKIVGFVCRDSAMAAAEGTASKEKPYSPSVTLVEMPCTGRVDTIHILRAFREGVDAVFVAGCLEGNCKYQYGNIEARKRVTLTKSLLQAAGLEPERLEMFNLASNQEWRFVEIVQEMVSRVEKLGEKPIGKVKT
ncbi:MAG: hydrogenase iron-sulfur subunit [Methanomassiliicoccales archaeon]|jgi:coenzyme F420-reducing hydrogenase delta subunit